jgi:hypothetical protein
MAKKKEKKEKKEKNGKPEKVEKVEKEISKKSAKKPSQIVEIIVRKKVLGEAPEEHHFVVSDGSKLGSVLELADALETMTEEVFSHHVNDMRNDFSAWIKDIFEDHNLADDIAKARNKMEAEVAILRRLVRDIK